MENRGGMGLTRNWKFSKSIVIRKRKGEIGYLGSRIRAQIGGKFLHFSRMFAYSSILLQFCKQKATGKNLLDIVKERKDIVI